MAGAGRSFRNLVLAGSAVVALHAGSLPKPGPLRPGEGLVVCEEDAPPRTYGDVARPAPIGGLARMLWLKLVGLEWDSQGVRYRCTGGDAPFPCGGAEGHGRVDLEGAFRKGCDRAFLAWGAASMARWRQEEGGSVARFQLLEVFGPFLGDRVAPGDGLPEITPAWIGRGDLLQASPSGLAAWLEDPLQMDLLTALQRYCSGYFVDIKFLLGRDGWWILPATAPTRHGGTRAWVVAGRDDALVVLRLPAGRGRVEGLARLKAILALS